MRLKACRIAPVPDAELTAAQHEVLEALNPRARPLNLFRTAVRTPAAMRSLLVWGNYIQGQANDLPPREKELVILRIGFLCRAAYEWAQHEVLGAQAGLTADEISRIKAGPAAESWSAADRALLAACDDLHTGQFIGDDAWTDLSRHFTEKQRMDVVYTAAHYTQICMILNTFGIQLDPGLVPDPDLVAFES